MSDLWRTTRRAILAVVLGFAFGCVTEVSAGARTFPSGSYIIPVEPCWQPNSDPQVSTVPSVCDTDRNDHGVFHAYGMLYDLLSSGIPVYWIINPGKTHREDVDFSVVRGGTSPAVRISHSKTLASSGGLGQVDYRGGPFVIDVNDLAGEVRGVAENIVMSRYASAKVHTANYDFSAPVEKILSGAPPKVAILGEGSVEVLLQYLKASGLGNRMSEVFTKVTHRDIIYGGLNGFQLLWAPHWIIDTEVPVLSERNKVLDAIRSFLERGNAAFFACGSVGSVEGSWDFLAPSRRQTRVIGRDSQTSGGFLTDREDSFPRLDVNSHLITGLDRTGLTAIHDHDLVFERPALPLAQCAGWKYVPSAGVIENFRPRTTAVAGSPSYALDPGPYGYNATVARFIHDRDTHAYAHPAPAGPPGVDYFAGGYIDGGSGGYVTYLAGHQYVRCRNEYAPIPSERQLEITFDRDIRRAGDTIVHIEVVHPACVPSGTAGSGPACPKIGCDLTNPSDQSSNDGTLYVNAGSAVYTPLTLTLSPLVIGNLTAANKTVTKIVVTFTNERLPDAQPRMTRVRDITDGREPVQVCAPNTPSESVCTAASGGGTLALGSLVTSCTVDWGANTSSGSSNTCGIRYVLNTLLGLQFQIVPREYNKASPIVKDGILYKGTFEYPGYKGHLYALDVVSNSLLWDAGRQGTMPAAGSANPGTPGRTNTTRYIFTSLPGSSTLVNFDDGNAALLKPHLDPAGVRSLDWARSLISHVRGRHDATEATPLGTRDVKKRLGGIERSTPAVFNRSPVIRDASGAVMNRDRVVFVGGDDGMLHAFYAGSWDGNLGGYTQGTGSEIWAFIPSTLLPALQNQTFTDCGAGDSLQGCDPNRDPNKCICPLFSVAVSVDGSPALGDFFVHHDNDPGTANGWKTVLVGTAVILVPDQNLQRVNQGIIFALDITDPYAPSVLWEKTYRTGVAPVAKKIARHYYPNVADYNHGRFPGAYVSAEDSLFEVNMGNSRGVAVGRVQVGANLNTYVFLTSRWIKPVNTGTADNPHNVWGLSAHALDLRTGDIVWSTKLLYTGDAEGINETPAIPVLMDIDENGTQDYVVFGDMQGRMWILRASDGKNITGDMPAYVVRDSANAPAGAKEPIGSSVSAFRNSIIFGTGARDSLSGESTTSFRIFAVQVTPSGVSSLWKDRMTGRDTAVVLEAGEKVWSPPLADAQGNIYIATGQGYSDVGRPDLVRNNSKGRFILVDRKTGTIQEAVALPGGVAGGMDIENRHACVVTFDGTVVQIGGDDFAQSGVPGNPIKILWWKKL